MHVLGDDQFRLVDQRDLSVLQETGNDTKHFAAMADDGSSEDAHQSDRAAAIDETDFGFGEDGAEPLRSGGIGGVSADG